MGSSQPNEVIPRCRYKMVELVESVNSILGPEARFNLADIRNPHPERVQAVFSNLLKVILGDHVDVNKIPDPVVGRYVFPETQSCLPPIALLGLFRGLFKNLHPNLGFQDMELRDVLSPEKTRFHRFLSNLINFCAFRNAKMDLVENTESELSDKRSKIVEFRRQIEEYNSQLNDSVMASEERKNDISQIRRELNAAAATTRGMSEEVKSAQSTVKNSQKSEEKCVERVAHLENCIENLKIEKERLQDQCVSSPDKLKAEAASLRGQVEKTQQEARSRSEEAGRITDEVERMRQCVASAKIAAETVKRCGAVLKEAPLLKEEEQNKAKALQDVRFTTQNLSLQLDEWQSRFEQLKKGLADARTEQEHEVGEIRHEVETIEKDRFGPLEASLKRLADEVNEVKTMQKLVKEECDGKSVTAQDIYDEFDQWKQDLKQQAAAELEWEVKEFQALVAGLAKKVDELEIHFEGITQVWATSKEARLSFVLRNMR